MSAKTNFTICSFNINGTKDKGVFLDQKLENFDVLFLQEHFLPIVSLNFLRRSNEHLVFFSTSGGIACLIKKTLFSPPPLRYHESDCYIATRLANLVLINVYLPFDQKCLRSLTKFTKSWALIKSLLSGIESNGLDWLFIDDLNCNINSSSVWTELLLDSLPNSSKILKKDASHSYIHNSSSLSDIDHCIVSSGLFCGEVHVDQDERDYDRLPLSLTVTLNATAQKNLRPNFRKWISKREWNKAD